MNYTIRLVLAQLLILQLLIAPSSSAITCDRDAQDQQNQVNSDQAGLDRPRMILKNNTVMLVLDSNGMISGNDTFPFGLYESDTRFLNRWRISLGGKQLSLLKAFTGDGYAGKFLWTNASSATLPTMSLMLVGDTVIHDGVTQRLTLQNYTKTPVKTDLTVSYGFDFKDMFEVRGQKREKTGERPTLKVDNSAKTVTAKYRGLDKREYQTTMKVLDDHPGMTIDDSHCNVPVHLKPGEELTLELNVQTSNSRADKSTVLDFKTQKDIADSEFRNWLMQSITTVAATDPTFTEIVRQSIRDLHMLLQDTSNGRCITAGLPWYAVPFGRDQAITATQILSFAPTVSKDVIEFLAHKQGTKQDKFTEEEPGKIMHELRSGEMARCREIAFVPYYGTVDATPLWLGLLCKYVDSTGDIDLAKTHWSKVEAAIEFLKRSTPEDFLYYGQQSGGALSNQAWKDSGDSIMHKDGKLAAPPIAVCEVQGYLYDAWTGVAKLAERLEKKEMSLDLTARAERLRKRFREKFWLPDNRLVALALDGTGKPCSVAASNAGHLLATGIIDDEIADAITASIMSEDMFSGNGVRTLSAKEIAYNPMSYHNGSVWPHDNAMIIAGLAARGKTKEAARLTDALLEVAKQAPNNRFPELFCGFKKFEFPSTVPYPVSCVPQAWCAGAVFQLLSSSLGLHIENGELRIANPTLPAGIVILRLRRLHVGKEMIDLEFRKDEKTGEVTYTKHEGSRQILY